MSEIKKLKLNDGEYVGEVKWADGFIRPHGKGKKTYSYGSISIYEGDWVDGYQTGNGKVTYSNGRVYEGVVVKGRRHGRGKYTSDDGTVCEGDWVDDKFPGIEQIENNATDAYIWERYRLAYSDSAQICATCKNGRGGGVVIISLGSKSLDSKCIVKRNDSWYELPTTCRNATILGTCSAYEVSYHGDFRLINAKVYGVYNDRPYERERELLRILKS